MRGTNSKSATPPSSPSTRSSTTSTSSRWGTIGLALIPSRTSLVAADNALAWPPALRKRVPRNGSKNAAKAERYKWPYTRPSGPIDLHIYSLMVNKAFSDDTNCEPNNYVDPSSESTLTVAGKLQKIVFEQEKGGDWVIDWRTEYLLEAFRAPFKERDPLICEYVKGLKDAVDDSHTNRSTNLESRRESLHDVLEKPLNDLLRIKLLIDRAEAFPRIDWTNSDGKKMFFYFDANVMRSVLNDICKESKHFNAFLRAIDTKGTILYKAGPLHPAFSPKKRPKPPPSAKGRAGPCKRLLMNNSVPVWPAKKSAVLGDTLESFIQNLTSIENRPHKSWESLVTSAEALSTNFPNAVTDLRNLLRSRCTKEEWAPELPDTSTFLGSRSSKCQSTASYLSSINSVCAARTGTGPSFSPLIGKLLKDIYCLDHMASSSGYISGDTTASTTASISTSTSVNVSNAEVLEGHAKRNNWPCYEGGSLLYSLHELYYNSPIVLAYMLALNRDQPAFEKRIENWYQLRKKASVVGVPEVSAVERLSLKGSDLFAPMDLTKLDDLELARFLFVIPSESKTVNDIEVQEKTVANMEIKDWDPRTVDLLRALVQRNMKTRKAAVSKFVSDFQANLTSARGGRPAALLNLAASLKVFRALLDRIETSGYPLDLEDPDDPRKIVELTFNSMSYALPRVCEEQADLRSAISELSANKKWAMKLWRTPDHRIQRTERQALRRKKLEQDRAAGQTPAVQKSPLNLHGFLSDDSFPERPVSAIQNAPFRPPTHDRRQPPPLMAGRAAVHPPVNAPMSAPPQYRAPYRSSGVFPGGLNGGSLPPPATGNAPPGIWRPW